jgi:hypothetical protein
MPSPARALAERVVACEGNPHDNPREAVAAAVRVLERLDYHLARWLGADGVRAILMRAADRASVGHPVLADVRDNARGNHFPANVAESMQRHDATTVSEALVALVAALFDLLGRLIGDDLAAQLAYQIWPEAMPVDATVPPPPSPSLPKTRTTFRE